MAILGELGSVMERSEGLRTLLVKRNRMEKVVK